MLPLRKFWLSNYFIGVGRFIFLQIGRWIWGYPRWHCSPVNRKPYVLDIIDTVEKMIEDGIIGTGYIVEVGCGRGDIIGNIRYEKRVGIDIDGTVINAAKFFHSDMEFIKGEFDAIPVDDIDVLIVAGFLHGASPEYAHELLSRVLPKTKLFIFDVFLDAKGDPLPGWVDESHHAYTHSGEYLCDGKFGLIYKGKEFQSSAAGLDALRHMEYWLKKE